jgi:hypothetical protein
MKPAAREGKTVGESCGGFRFSGSGFCKFSPSPFFLKLLFFWGCSTFALVGGFDNAPLFAQQEAAVAVADSMPVLSTPNAPAVFAPEFFVQTWFGHDIQLYLWQTQLRFQQALATNWQLQVLGSLNSIMQPQSSGDLWKDDHQAGVQLAKPMPGNGRLEFLAEARIFRDALTGSATSDFGNNDFSSSRVRLNHEWHAAARLRVAPSLGYCWEEILGRHERGPAAGLSLVLAPTDWADYAHQFDGAVMVENLAERRNEDLSLFYGVSRQFESNTTDSVFVRFTHLRRENYFTTEYIDLVLRNRRVLENRLHYRLSSAWRFFLRSELGEAAGEVARRTVASENSPATEVSRFRHDDLESSHLAALFFEKNRARNEFALNYRSRRRAYEIPDSLRASPLIRRYASEGYDSDWWDFALSHRLQWQIGKRDSVRWFGRVARYALTTANLEDPNDHDRLQVHANLLYLHRFNPHFSMAWEVRSYLEHQVYLKKNLSGDNRWMRIWQLLPDLIFEPMAGVKFKQSFGVRATYIDYDFPETLSRRKSIVFRDFFIADSLSFPLSSRTTAALQYKLILEERGLLDWARWLQSPQIDLRRQWAMISFWHRWSAHWEIFPGVSFYRETHWKYQPRPGGGWQREFNGNHTILAPLLQIGYLRPPSALLLLNWRRQMSFRTLTDNRLRRDRNIDTFNLTVQWSW